MNHPALHDPETDLPNRRLFLERADRSLRGLGRRSGLVAVLSIEVPGLSAASTPAAGAAPVEEGDSPAARTARVLVGVLRPADTPARLGEERFAVLIDRLDEPWEAIAVAERVLAAAPAGATRAVAIGVALADGSHPWDAETLLQHADEALARAREAGSRYEVYEASLGLAVRERMSLGWALRDALRERQLVVEYQPEVALPSRRLLGLEALLRWDRPGHPRLPPGAFLDLAESSGLIVPIGAWVLREACRRAREWRRDPRAAGLGLRVNLSARQFEEPGLVDAVAGALAEAELPPSALCLEITETVLMSNAPASLETLTALKALGVGLAVDDFGIGYSSLAYLKRFPVDTLKIDRSFVEGLGTDPIDLPIVQAIVMLGKTLGLQVVAEGIERPLQEQTLRALGCDRGQGYLFSRPLPADDVPSLFGNA
jgi:diguanylate cyclase (GGDEF)-like protein